MKPIIAFALLGLSSSVLASVRIQEELYIPGNKPEVIKELIDSGSVEIDHVTSAGFEVYGPEGISRYLDQKNIVHFDMKALNKSVLADYPTSAQIAEQLRALQKKYSKIMTLTSIGKSVKGKDLLVMKISDNPNVDEVEPEFKYISSMHGDEITGREMMVRLIEEIGEKYGTDPEITDLVNNTEIFIMASMNPDGSDMKMRSNGNYRDLNRNFPDIIKDRESTTTGREPEVQHVMRWQASRQFALSANFHGGTVVANYPWDSKYDPHPMDAFIQELAKGYADLNPEMRSSREFQGGITNGAEWYIVRGGMQDWSYFWHNDLQLTIEVSHQKWPRYSEMPSFYQDNRDSLFYYMKQIHRGAGFRFKRSGVQGTVEITQTSPERKELGSFAFKGSEFYKVLPEGEYSFTIKERNKGARNISVRVEKDSIKPNGNYLIVD